MKLKLVLLVFLVTSVSVWSYNIQFPEMVYNNQDLSITLAAEDGEAEISAARLYFFPRRSEDLVFSSFSSDNEQWESEVPAEIMPETAFTFFIEIKDAGGGFHRVPGDGYREVEVTADAESPQAELLFPKSPRLLQGEDQVILIKITDMSGIADYSAEFEGSEVKDISLKGELLKLILKPRAEDQQSLGLILTDTEGNTAEESIAFTIQVPERTPFFRFNADYVLDAELEYAYEKAFNPAELSDDPLNSFTKVNEFLAEGEQEYPVSFVAGGFTEAAAGPFRVGIDVQLADENKPQNIIDSVRSNLTADYYDFLRLLHPWNFSNEFTFDEKRVRTYESGNFYTFKADLFNDKISYVFGDQDVTFQDYTVSSLDMRGTSANITIPGLTLKVAKGLTDSGFYKTNWPQNFIGIQAGINVNSLFWLQTNVSIISDFQGRYEDITSGSSLVEDVFGLSNTASEQNLVIGVGTGTENSWFNANADFALSIYIDDSSTVIDVEDLYSQLFEAREDPDNPGSTLDPMITLNESAKAQVEGYLDSLDRFQSSVFPIFDYFPLNNGIIGNLISKELWGIVYSLRVEIVPLELDLHFYKGDKSYKSLAASASNDLIELGASWDGEIGDFSLSGEYTYQRNTVQDILTNEILSLFLSESVLSLIPSPEAGDTAEFSQELDLQFSTPSWKRIGGFGLGYNISYEYTNDSSKLAAFTSAENISFIHSFDYSWSSDILEINYFSSSLKLSGTEVLNHSVMVGGSDAAAGETFWEHSLSIEPSMDYKKLNVDFSAAQSWSSEQGSGLEREYELRISLPWKVIDDISFSGDIENVFDQNNTLLERTTGVSLDFEKDFSSISLEVGLEAAFKDNMLDNSDDELSGAISLIGGVSF